MVKAHPGPLGRERLGGRLSSYSVSLSRYYPVDETSDDNAVLRTNGGIAAFLPNLNRCQVLRHEADDGPFYRWPLTKRIDEQLETRLTAIVEPGYNRTPPGVRKLLPMAFGPLLCNRRGSTPWMKRLGLKEVDRVLCAAKGNPRL